MRTEECEDVLQQGSHSWDQQLEKEDQFKRDEKNLYIIERPEDPELPKAS